MSNTPPSREQVVSDLTMVFREVFDDDRITISDLMTAKDLKQWDSLNHINLVVASEQKFGISFTTAEVTRLENVGQFVDAILRKLTAATSRKERP